jgi:hypothetical protein
MKLGRYIGLELIKQAVEWGTTESQSTEHAPLSEGSDVHDPARHISTLFDQNAERDPMSDEVPGLNFRGSDMHYASPKYAVTMNHGLVWDPSLWTTFNDEKMDHVELPGKKPVVQDNYDTRTTSSVWDEHGSFESNKGVVDGGVSNPGPAV